MNASVSVSNGLAMLADAPPWVVLLVKVTAILLAALALDLALWRTNPRWRVLLWRGVAVGVIVLPALVCLVPAFEIRVEPPPSATEAGAVAVLPATPSEELQLAGPASYGPAPYGPASYGPPRIELRKWQKFGRPDFTKSTPFDPPVDSGWNSTAFSAPIEIENRMRDPGPADPIVSNVPEPEKLAGAGAEPVVAYQRGSLHSPGSAAR